MKNVKEMTNEELISTIKNAINNDYASLQEVYDEISKRKLLPRYFVFHDENTEMSYLLPVSCSVGEYNEWFDSELEEINSFIPTMEDKYGVHDSFDTIDCECETFGFTSYEVEKI